MQNQYYNKNSDHFEDEIDFKELFYVLLSGKWIIISVTGFMSTVAVIYSLLLPNIYESTALLVPVNSSNNISGAIRNYSGLAGFAGINITPGEDEGNSTKAQHKLSSLSFFEDSILKNIYLPNLMALKSWIPETNTLVYDKKIFDQNKNLWVRKYSFPQQQIPSAQESFEVFITNHLTISEDKETGFIYLSIKHKSPYIAKYWVELIINQINSFYRQKDKAESEKAVSYLNKQISITGLSEIQQVIAELLQEETKKLTLIEANESYVFDYIDPPALMELKSEPNRAVICILLAIMGGIMGSMIVIIRHYFFTEKDFKI